MDPSPPSREDESEVGWIVALAAAVAVSLLQLWFAWRGIARLGLWAFLVHGFRAALMVMGLGIGGVLAAYSLFRLITAAVGFARPRRPRVFISFKNELSDDARKIATALGGMGFEVLMLPFEPRDHDDTIDEVQGLLDRAAAMVVVPGAERGFFEAEILVASKDRKPVILVGRRGAFRLPATAYSGYPVMDAEQLEASQFRPLGRLLHYAVRDRESTRMLTTTATKATWNRMSEIFWLERGWRWLLLVVLLAGLISLAVFLRGAAAIDAKTSSYAALLAVAPFILFGSLVRAFVVNGRVRRVITQQIRTRRLTNQTLRDLLDGSDEDKDVLDVLLDDH